MLKRHTISTAILLIVALASACDTVRVNIAGNSMAPTLSNGERALVSRSFDSLQRGDIVAFRYPKDESRSFVQRIVAVAGERIESRDGNITVNGRPIEEAYVAEANRSRDTWGPVVVPAGHFFMMGDNRSNSMDSRAWGLVRREAIWGKLRR